MAKWVSKTELARIAGVSKAAITKAALIAFPDALDGHRVDLDHEQTRRYLQKRGADPTLVEAAARSGLAPTPRGRPSTKPKTEPAAPPAQPAPPPTHHGTTGIVAVPPRPPPSNIPIEEYGNLTLNQLLRLHGTVPTLVHWLEASKRIADITEKNLKNEERAGRLISRELVKTHLFAHIDATNRRLLQDAAPTITRRLYSAVRAGEPYEAAERTVREIIGSHLRPLKDTAARVLREGEEP